MPAWLFSIGNAARRAAAAPVPVAPAQADPDLGLDTLASDAPDEQAALAWRADGTYAIDQDLSQLLTSSSAADAPTGWRDLLLLLAGTPGLPANPPDWNTYAARAQSLRVFRPTVQDVEVQPGESMKLQVGLYLPLASTATGARVVVTDLSTGRAWNGAAWVAGGVVASQAVDDAWLDVDEEIPADAARAERAFYRVVIEPVAAAYDATTYVYASSPALFPAFDVVALLGHNLPAGAVVTIGGVALTPVQPSCYAIAGASLFVRVPRISIQMPAGTHSRPVIGGLWIGLARTMLIGSPIMPIGLTESSPGQLQAEGARGRREIVAEDEPPVAEIELQFRAATAAAYQQLRDALWRATRSGADPLLLLPAPSFAGAGRVLHGRVENRVTFSWETPGADGVRAFSLPFHESPFAAPIS